MSAVLAAARQGDRHSHAAGTSDHDGGALLSVATGALVAAAHQAGVAITMLGAGAASGGGAHITTRDVIPFDTSGVVAKGSPRTFLGAGRIPAALAGADPLDCRRHHDGPIRTGSATVFADGLRFARQSDQTACGAVLCDGDKTVLVGGAPVDGAPPDPLAAITRGPALASVAVGAALAIGTEAVAAAQRWGEALVGEAVATATAVTTTLADAAGALAAQAGALLGAADGELLGPRISGDLGDPR
ncbi:MAG: PAAR domain-containing protein [Minicystis sp.]